MSNVGLDGNSPEIAAAIEAAVQDGMDVINLSIGEPEIPPSRDLVVRAIDGAAAAGVVSTVSAGNDFEAFGRGSVSSPGSAASAITVGRDHGQPAAGGLLLRGTDTAVAPPEARGLGPRASRSCRRHRTGGASGSR